MIFPKYQKTLDQYNCTVIHHAPCKFFAILNLIINSTQGRAIKKRISQALNELKKPGKKIFDRVIDIIIQNYPPKVQKELFKALCHEDFQVFLMKPVNNTTKLLKKDLEDYQWSKILESKEIGNVGKILLRNYTPRNKGDDFWYLLKGLCSSAIFGSQVNFSTNLTDTAKKRLTNITQKKAVKKVIKKSTYDLLKTIADDIKLTQQGNFLKGKYAAKLKKGYKDQLTIVIKQLKKNGINLAREQIIKFRDSVTNDSILRKRWQKFEPVVRNKTGILMKFWIDQFFPDRSHKPTQLQVLATAMIREILYGKPESIIVLTVKQDAQKYREGNFELRTINN